MEKMGSTLGRQDNPRVSTLLLADCCQNSRVIQFGVGSEILLSGLLHFRSYLPHPTSIRIVFDYDSAQYGVRYLIWSNPQTYTPNLALDLVQAARRSFAEQSFEA